jgi:hypothetical protein
MSARYSQRIGRLAEAQDELAQMALNRPYKNFEKKFAKRLTNSGGRPSIGNCSARQSLYRVAAVGTPSTAKRETAPSVDLPQNGDPENIGAFSSLTTELSKPRQSKF